MFVVTFIGNNMCRFVVFILVLPELYSIGLVTLWRLSSSCGSYHYRCFAFFPQTLLSEMGIPWYTWQTSMKWADVLEEVRSDIGNGDFQRQDGWHGWFGTEEAADSDLSQMSESESG